MFYRKKPIVVEAMQAVNSDSVEFVTFCGSDFEAFADDDSEIVGVIHTLEGDMTVMIDDFVIKGVDGETYPCKPEIFHKTYERV